MKILKKIWKTGLAIVLAVSVLSGCQMAEVISSEKGGVKEYGKPETMMILSTEKFRYEELYTDKIWEAAVDHRGTAFESVLISQVHDFMQELKLMSNMAEEREISLTSREKELVKEAASRYWNALGADQAEAFELEARDAEELYRDYWMAEKLVEQLTGGMNLEVSDSEAKVIEVAQIEVSDRAAAEEILALVQTENSDFNAIAKEYSENEEIKKKIHYGMLGDAYERAAYGLAADEISGIVEESGKYYILKCINDYDVEATKARKEEMVRQKKNEAFHSSYQAYKADKTLNGDVELWSSLSMGEIPDTEADFFAIFEEVCLEQE